MNLQSLEAIKKAGFVGFKSISQLWNESSIIPNEKGVYLIINSTPSNKEFLETSVGGWFKNENPTKPITYLESNWVEASYIIYIGQAGGNNSLATLKKRLKQYLNFGKGKPAAHRGGKLIWQLKNHSELIVAWKTLKEENPSIVESQLLKDFVDFYGKLPFANLKM